jgi:hypothetical protein
MGILNIDEHVEEHRLMAIRYPDKAVIPGQSVISQSGIPFLIMPGDGGANGCSFSGSAGAFTLSAAIVANIGTALAGCYAYFSANFGGSTLPAGWYWTEFSSDTAGIVYANTYTSGDAKRPVALTPISVALTGYVTASTSEISGPSGFALNREALGKNGILKTLLRCQGSTGGNKTYRMRAGNSSTTQILVTGSAASPNIDGLHCMNCVDSHTVKYIGRINASGYSGVGVGAATAVASSIVTTMDTSVDNTLYLTMQGSTNLSAPILLGFEITATYGQ